MKLTEKKRSQATLETIQIPGHEAQITMSLRLSKTSVRGEREYRKTLKAVIAEAEQRLGPYRRRKA